MKEEEEKFNKTLFYDTFDACEISFLDSTLSHSNFHRSSYLWDTLEEERRSRVVEKVQDEIARVMAVGVR